MANTDVTANQQVKVTFAPHAQMSEQIKTMSASPTSKTEQGKGLDQIAQAKSGNKLSGGKNDSLQDPLAKHAPTPGPGGGGTAFSHIDYFSPGIAYISMEVSQTLVKSGIQLIGAEGELRNTQISDFESQNQSYASNEKKSILFQALGAAVMGVVGVVACSAGFLKLGFDVKGAKPDENRIDELQKGIQAKTDQLNKPTLTVEGAGEGEDLAENEAIKPKADSGVRADDQALLDVEVNGDGEGEKANPAPKGKAKESSDPQALRDEIKGMKTELTTLQGKQTTYWGRANTTNQAMQTGINAFGKLGEAGAQVGQAHYAYLRDMEGGLKQTTSQLLDAVGSTFSQTTQFLSSIINSTNQNLGTIASMAMRLA